MFYIYYKELAHVIMEVEKSQDLQLASWRHRRTDGVVPVWVERSENQESQWCKFQSESRQAPLLIFQFKSEGKDPCLSLSSQSGGVLSKLSAVSVALQLIRWSPCTLGRAVCFTQSTYSSVNLIQKHSLRHTQNYVWPNVWALYGPVKLTHKISHHNDQEPENMQKELSK